MQITDKITITNEDNVELMSRLKNESIDVICIDPPYLYLKNQKLERVFDENKFFIECKRLMAKKGFIIMFGRGASFYRWNTILDSLGYIFKEEIIWDKSHGTSPLMPISRVHETVSIWCKGNGKINKVKIPYLEQKRNDVESIVGDIKRMRSILNNSKSLDAVLKYIETNKRDVSDSCEKTMLTISSDITKEDRSVSVVRSIQEGMNEKTIIRCDRKYNEKFTKHGVTSDNRGSGDRACDVMQSIDSGMNEKSIIKEIRNHYKSIHPTEKPVRLLERLIQICIVPSNPKCVIADFFGGSMSTMEAVINLSKTYPQIKFEGISCEIDEEYFNLGKERIIRLSKQQKLF